MSGLRKRKKVKSFDFLRLRNSRRTFIVSNFIYTRKAS